LMIVGSNLDNPAYLELMEDLGGLIVTDYLCNGTLYFWEQVDETLPPIEALARRSLHNLSCPRMIGDFPRRLNFIQEMLKTIR